jgi:hypothetical protein
MKTINSLTNIQEKVSEETFQEIMQVMEGLFVNDGRGDLFDDISKALTGKPVIHHVRKGTSKAVKFLGKQIKKAIENRKAKAITK